MGGFYVMDGQSIETLLAATQTTPYFAFEDIYLTGLCASKVNITINSQLERYQGSIHLFLLCVHLISTVSLIDFITPISPKSTK